jgi:hypothetical protein
VIYNELEIPSPDEQNTREARWNMERAKMHVLEHREWPKGAESDGKLYSLECSRSERMTEAGEWEVVTTPGDGEFAQVKPDLTPITGTYAEVAGYANKLNTTQASNGPVYWVYCPALIQPQAVA